MTRVFTLLCLLMIALACHAREEMTLNGSWEVAKVADLTTPPTDGWTPFSVPGTLSGGRYDCAWFRRTFTIPRSMGGQRIEIHFGGVKYNSVVRVNGQKVGRYFGGYDPFDVDITAVAKVGEENLLELGCHDWTGIMSEGRVDFNPTTRRPVDARSIPKDKLLAPVGGLWQLYGPWDEVKLRSHPAVYIKDLFIKPSWRNKQLRVEYTLANQSDTAAAVTVNAAVDDQGARALQFAPTAVTIAPGSEVSTALVADWPAPHCWSPEDPYLYFLVSRLSVGDQSFDEVRTRFGFRELWIEGPRFLLNGAHITFLATSWWPPREWVTKEYIQDQIGRIKAANCVAFRTHTQPWPEIWYETADEMGLMMIPEGAVWNDDDTYRVNDPVFWDNYAKHLHAMVNREKNRASTVMYSLENEFYGGRINDRTPCKADLVRMGRLVRQWDPTRPFMYESDGDPDGVADVIGIHYPHEYPQFTQWPNTAYWMDTPKVNPTFFTNGSSTWLWDRTKPVYIGEFLWIPSSDPSWDTVFFGDDTYLDYNYYHRAAKGESWKMAIQAYRYYGVGGISPWTMVEGGALDADKNPMYAAQKYAMQHTAAYLREYDHNFFAGEIVTRTADVYNDTLSPANLVFQWALMQGERELHRGEKTLTMEPGERREVSFEALMPLVQERTPLSWRLRLLRGGEQVFEDTRPCAVHPLLALRQPARMPGLFDPSGRTGLALQKAGLQTVPVTDLRAIPTEVRELIVGADALQSLGDSRPIIGAPSANTALMDFARAGGRVLVLEQSALPLGALPVTLTPNASTMTFPQVPDHPLLRGLEPLDLKWWRPDNLVSRSEVARPGGGGSRAVVVSGSQAGIAQAPLLELPVGRGLIVVCQLRVSERLGVEPAAGVLLQNALDYLPAFQPFAARTAAYFGSPQARDVLDGLGLVYTDISGSPETADWGAIDLLIVSAPVQGLKGALAQVEALVARGGTVLLHGLKPEDLELVKPLVGDITLRPYRCAATRVPGAHPLSSFLTNEDCYWVGPQSAAHSWATRPMDDGMASFVVGKNLTDRKVAALSHNEMTVAGTYASNSQAWAILATSGSTVSGEVEIPKDGPYVIGINAGGTPCADVYPAGLLLVDGKSLGGFQCQKRELSVYTVAGRLTAGKHTLTVQFTNDASRPPLEDRNLYVEGLVVTEDDPAQGGTFLTSPAALVVFERGGGRVVLDEVNWDTTQTNATKAQRYIGGLLTGLGAQFTSTAQTVLAVNDWAHKPDMSWYRPAADGAYLGDNGWIESPVECARDGRYVLRIVARGTSAAGVFPIIVVSLDGREVGSVELKSDQNRGYPLTVDIPAGQHLLRLTFTNDLNVDGEDRNLNICRVEVSAAQP